MFLLTSEAELKKGEKKNYNFTYKNKLDLIFFHKNTVWKEGSVRINGEKNVG